jgi:hypothetical protein
MRGVRSEAVRINVADIAKSQRVALILEEKQNMIK